jgi:nicotinamide-nucleotide amidase
MQSLTTRTAAIAERLIARGDTICVAESSAGGLIASQLLAVPGASAYFMGGAVIYTHEARRAILGVPDEAMKGIQPSTDQYVKTLAQAMHAKMGTTWCIGESGATGPTGSYKNAPGHAALCILGPVEKTLILETADDDRQRNMWVFSDKALELLEQALDEAG